MSINNSVLFITLLRVKSYLLSLLDNPDDAGENLELTKEFLSRKFPDQYDEIIYLLTKNGITSDSDIAFNDQIHSKFYEIISMNAGLPDLKTLLNDLNITELSGEKRQKQLDELNEEREARLKKIIGSLFELAKIWVSHKELESELDDYAILQEEEMLRKDEEKVLHQISDNTNYSFNRISQLTQIYLRNFTDYYFDYGGNVALDKFMQDMEKLQSATSKEVSGFI